MKTILRFSLVLIAILQTSTALAHRIRVFAWEDGGKIVTESKFNGGRAARQATITVYEGEKTLLKGKTDDSGIFSFPLPAETGEFNIVVSTGDGHKGSWLYSTTMEEASVTDNAPPPATPPAVPDERSSIDYQKIETAVARALDQQLTPIRRQLAEAQDQDPTIQDILGGIGYILGLAGIAAYMQSRKKGE